MRVLRVVAAASIGLAIVPACARAPGCSYPRLVPLAAGSFATSCAAGLLLEDTFYSQGCRPVRSTAVGEVLARGDRSFEVYVMRAIDGVEPTKAVAVRTVRPNDAGYTEAIEQECGRWQLYVTDAGDVDELDRVTDPRRN